MGERLDYIWRLLATGFCFSCFGLGGLFMALTLFPLTAMLPSSSDKRRQRIQRLISFGFRQFLRMVQWLGVGQISVTNGERLASEGRRLVLANHPTLLDVVVLVSLMPYADCVVKQALWRNPFLWGVVRGARYVSNSSPEAVIDDCADLLRQERRLVIFPEGTRSVPGQPMRFQRGAARIALKSRAPILPVTVICEPATLTKGNPWYRIPRKRWHIHVMAHEPVEVEQLLKKEIVSEPVAVRRVTEALQQLFGQKINEHESTYQRIARIADHRAGSRGHDTGGYRPSGAIIRRRPGT